MAPPAVTAGHARTAALLRGVDRSAFAVALAVRLRAAGVAVGFSAIDNLVHALTARPPRSRPELYWTARICLVRRQPDLAAFEAVFDAVFADAVLEMDPHARRTPLAAPGEANHPVPQARGATEVGGDLPWATRPRVVATAEDGGDDNAATTAVPQRLATAVAGIVDLPFEQLDIAQMQLLGRWLQAALPAWPTRRSRRTAPGPHGHRIALRPTIERSRRTAWEPVEIVTAKRVDKPRRVVMLCDVSESMRPQATAYLHLMRVLALQANAEVFAFATSLTRLTPALAQHSAQAAIAQATAKVGDRFGGTRIATNVAALLDSTHADAVRGAVVLLGSDGWDSDPPEQLARAMARLRRRAHRVLWLNPRAAAPGYEPKVGALAAALPSCDQMLAADTFRSLAGVITAIGTLRVSSTASRGSRVGTARH